MIICETCNKEISVGFIDNKKIYCSKHFPELHPTQAWNTTPNPKGEFRLQLAE
jgi:hypothetical protein|tara:strand:- start:9304 stop:9462 length:159 start_codon:yes stop_codon:yes gene_type:complete